MTQGLTAQDPQDKEVTMPSEKAKEDRVKKVQRTINLDEMASGFVALAQEKRNKLVGDAQAMAQTGEQTLRYAVETVFRSTETELPKTPVQIVKNQETGMPAALTWEEIVAKDDVQDGEDDGCEEDGGEEAGEPDETPSAIPFNGGKFNGGKRKLPVKG